MKYSAVSVWLGQLLTSNGMSRSLRRLGLVMSPGEQERGREGGREGGRKGGKEREEGQNLVSGC